MHLRLSPTFLEKFPLTLLGVVSVQGIDNTGERAAVTQLLRQAEAHSVQTFSGVSVTEHPHIAVWREAYRAFGSKPKDYPSSIENLVRRISKGYQLPPINPLVDIYNTISLRHILPVGGEDLAQVAGDIVLTIADANEAPVRLLGEPEARAPYLGEVIYKDDMGALCRRWNWKEADRTKLSAATRDAVLVIEALPPLSRALLETALGELAELIRTYCGGTAHSALLEANTPQTELS